MGILGHCSNKSNMLQPPVALTRKKIMRKMNERFHRYDKSRYSCAYQRFFLWYSLLVILLERIQSICMPSVWWETLKHAWSNSSYSNGNGPDGIMIDLIVANCLPVARKSQENMWSEAPANVWSEQRRKIFRPTIHPSHLKSTFSHTCPLLCGGKAAYAHFLPFY